MSGMQLVKSKASRRGYAALGMTILTLIMFVFGAPFFGTVGAGVSAFLVWRWFKFRAKWGLRF
jgi:hypothetical protein